MVGVNAPIPVPMFALHATQHITTRWPTGMRTEAEFMMAASTPSNPSRQSSDAPALVPTAGAETS